MNKKKMDDSPASAVKSAVAETVPIHSRMHDRLPAESAPEHKILHALHFAAAKHRDQRRKDRHGSPYVNHVIGVAHILAHEAGVRDPDVLCAAILHDTVEDTDTRPDELERVFGARVAAIVGECTDDVSLGAKERKAAQLEKAPSASPAAKLVKLADKVYNLRDLKAETPVGWSRDRVHAYFAWARDVVRACSGVHAGLDAACEEITDPKRTRILFEGHEYPCILDD